MSRRPIQKHLFYYSEFQDKCYVAHVMLLYKMVVRHLLCQKDKIVKI